MIRLLRRLSGAVLTVLGAATNTPTAAKQAAAEGAPVFVCIYCFHASHVPNAPHRCVRRPDCGTDFERHPNLRRLAGEPHNIASGHVRGWWAR